MQNEMIDIPIRRDLWQKIFRLAAERGLDATELLNDMLNALLLACEIKQIDKNLTTDFSEPATKCWPV